MTPLSVLDLATITSGTDAGAALQRTVRLAQRVERLGYRRLWFAEHHNMPSIASSAPDLLIAHVATATSTIRLGSGGVMLPNHAPLAVAERFGTLEALHPGRIDLGLGRAPGSDQLTALALRGSVDALRAEDFPQQLAELRAWLEGRFPADHPYRDVRAVPGPGYVPQLWMLGSSDFGARLAGALGLRFAFAHHFMPAGTLAALRAYRETFTPGDIERPHSMIGVGVVCGETDEEAARLASSMSLSIARFRTGRPGPLPSPEEVERHAWTPTERAIAEEHRANVVIGSPATVRERLERLVAATGVDELMVTTSIHDEDARLRSFELVLEAMAGSAAAA